MMHWAKNGDHMALAGGLMGLVTAIVGFRTLRKKKAGIPPPYSGEMAALLIAMIVGIAVIVFTR